MLRHFVLTAVHRACGMCLYYHCNGQLSHMPGYDIFYPQDWNFELIADEYADSAIIPPHYYGLLWILINLQRL